MSSDTLTRQLETELFPVPSIDARGVNDDVVNWYSRSIGKRIHELPQYVSSISNRLGGYAREFGSKLRNLTYRLRKDDPNLGGYFNAETNEIGYNGIQAEINPRFARHAVTHEKFHLLQKITKAIKMYTETLSNHYSEIYKNFGKKLESVGMKGMKNYMRNIGYMVGLYRAQAAIEGGASAATSLYEGEPSDDAYAKRGWTGKMKNAIMDLGLGPVLAPATVGEVLKVDYHLGQTV